MRGQGQACSHAPARLRAAGAMCMVQRFAKDACWQGQNGWVFMGTGERSRQPIVGPFPRTAALPEAEAGSEEEDEEAAPMTKPSKSKAKKKSAPVAAFALLAEDDEEGPSGSEGGSNEEGDEEVAEPVIPVVAKVISIKPHPKADRLRIVKLAAGPALGDVQVVSNAPGLTKHQLVALAVRPCLRIHPRCRVFGVAGGLMAAGVDVSGGTVRGNDRSTGGRGEWRCWCGHTPAPPFPSKGDPVLHAARLTGPTPPQTDSPRSPWDARRLARAWTSRPASCAAWTALA